MCIRDRISKVAEWIQKAVDWFNNLSPTGKKVVAIIMAIAAAIGPLLVVLGVLAGLIGNIMLVLPMMGGAIAAIAAPAGIAIGIIVALIAIGVALYKNWDKIKEAAGMLKDYLVEKFNALKDGIKQIFDGIKNAIVSPIKKAVEVVKALIEKIKGFFNFKVSLPKIKLPHFSIKPKGWELGDLLKGSIPTLGIEWHKEGVIFKKPTVIGKHGFGEAGAEAALPLDTLWTQMAEMFTKQADDIVNGFATVMRMMQAGAAPGELIVPIYLYPSGPKMGEETVKMYDKYKKIMG